MSRTNNRTTVLTTTLVASLTLAGWTATGCDDDTPGRAKTDTASTTVAASLSGDLELDYGKPTSSEPRPRIPSGPPPKRLTIEDFREGHGPEVEFGDAAVVNYVGYHYASKRHYDTSYGDNPVPYRVVPGADNFIEGFEEGIVGMKVGGLRQITIPPHKGYGDRGYVDQVKPGETLVFVVLLEALDKREE